jgi:hypothetical protein
MGRTRIGRQLRAKGERAAARAPGPKRGFAAAGAPGQGAAVTARQRDPARVWRAMPGAPPDAAHGPHLPTRRAA